MNFAFWIIVKLSLRHQLQRGDVVELEIERIGVLRNRVVQP